MASVRYTQTFQLHTKFFEQGTTKKPERGFYLDYFCYDHRVDFFN